MKLYFLAILFTFLAIDTVQAQEKPEWSTCTKNEECVVISYPCIVRAVNGKFQAEAGEFFRSQAAGMDCASYEADNASLSATCAYDRSFYTNPDGSANAGGESRSEVGHCEIGKKTQ